MSENNLEYMMLNAAIDYKVRADAILRMYHLGQISAAELITVTRDNLRMLYDDIEITDEFVEYYLQTCLTCTRDEN